MRSHALVLPLLAAGLLLAGSLEFASRAMNQDQSSQFLDALLNLPQLAGAHVSPDGKWVAWSWFHTGPAADVYVAPTDGSAKPRRLTQAHDDTMISDWSPDSKFLIVKHDKDGDERMQLFKLPIDGKPQLMPLTDENPDYFLRGGQIHPNGKWLIYGANYDFNAKKETEQTAVIRHDLQTGERIILARPDKGGYVVPHMNQQGTHILYDRNDLDPAGAQVWMVDIDGKNDHEILNFGKNKKVNATWMPDGKRVLFVTEANDYRKVGIFDSTTRGVTWLIDDPKRNIEFAAAPRRSDKIVIGEIRNAREVCSFMDPQTKAETACTSARGSLTPMEVAADGHWIGAYYSSTQPTELVRLTQDGQLPSQPQDLTDLWSRTKVEPKQLTAAEEYNWKSVDGRAIHGWLYKAKNPIGTVLVVHGGPTGHDEDAYDPQVQYLVASGFNVFNPNYRGSTGYGLEFEDAIKKCGWGGTEQDDIRTGIESLIKDGVAHAGKVGITGTSYGGYSSWHAITHFPTEVIAASAPICGMTDLVVDYETTRPDLRPYSEEMMGGTPTALPQRYRERSPINFVQNIKGKLLIIQGGQDPNVTPENVKQVEAALQKHGVRYETLIFPDEGHGIYRPANERTLFLRLADFFGKAFS